MRYIFKFLEYLLIILIIVFAASFYYKDRLVSIQNVSSSTLSDPIQTPALTPQVIDLKNRGYDYKITAIDDYKITGVVVSKHDYNPADDDVEKIMRFDLCLVWGKNVSQQTYLSPNISFSQGQRFCNFRYSDDTKFYGEELSNNHLITVDSSIIDTIKSINTGDEVVLTGKLVNMSASGTGSNVSGTQKYTWNTSVDRKDTGAGACEIIYIESVKVISSVHNFEVMINTYSLWGIMGIVALLFIRAILFILFVGPK